MFFSVIIVDFYKAKNIVENINELSADLRFKEVEFVILDNSNCIGNWRFLNDSLKKYKNIKLVNEGENVGYTKGYNVAVSNCTTSKLFIQNPDIKISSLNDYFTLCKMSVHRNDVAIFGVKQIEPDGNFASVVRNFPSLGGQLVRRVGFLQRAAYFKRLLLNYEFNNFDYNSESEVPWLQSSFYFMTKKNWIELGGFDERFFVFMADVDLCYRAWEKGKKVLYTPCITIYSDGQRSSHGSLFSIFKNKIIYIHVKDALKYYYKYLFKNKNSLLKV